MDDPALFVVFEAEIRVKSSHLRKSSLKAEKIKNEIKEIFT